jgi:hypothetical protein
MLRLQRTYKVPSSKTLANKSLIKNFFSFSFSFPFPLSTSSLSFLTRLTFQILTYLSCDPLANSKSPSCNLYSFLMLFDKFCDDIGVV